MQKPPMMESLASETVSTGEEVDIDLEDTLWNLMEKTGYLADLKTKILKFIDKSGKIADVNVIPERANSQILSQIFEYLRWIGMKNTCASLLTESPVDIDSTSVPTDDHKPALLSLFKDELNTNSIKINLDPSLESPKLPMNETYDLEHQVNGNVVSKEDGVLGDEDENENDQVTPYSAPAVVQTVKINSGAENGKPEVGNGHEHEVSLSPIPEDSSFLSDVSVDLNTEDISLNSKSDGFSTAEHEIKLN